MTNELSEEQKKYLRHLFWDHDEKINKKLEEELTILSKYKGELAKNYQQAVCYQRTLSQYMKDIIDNQEQVMLLFTDLIKVITNKHPKVMSMISPDKALYEEILITEVGLNRRVSNTLKAHNIEKLKDLTKITKSAVLRMQNLGLKSCYEIEKILHSYGLEFSK